MRLVLLILAFITFVVHFWITCEFKGYNPITTQQQSDWWVMRLAWLSIFSSLIMLAFWRSRENWKIKIVYDLLLGVLISDIYERLLNNTAEFSRYDIIFVFLFLLIDISKSLNYEYFKNKIGNLF